MDQTIPKNAEIYTVLDDVVEIPPKVAKTSKLAKKVATEAPSSGRISPKSSRSVSRAEELQREESENELSRMRIELIRLKDIVTELSEKINGTKSVRFDDSADNAERFDKIEARQLAQSKLIVNILDVVEPIAKSLEEGKKTSARD